MTEIEKIQKLMKKNNKANERPIGKIRKLRAQEWKATYCKYKGGFYIMDHLNKESSISKYEMTAFKVMPTRYSNNSDLKVMKWELFQEKGRHSLSKTRPGYSLTGREYTYTSMSRLDKHYIRVSEARFNKYLKDMGALMLSALKN